MVDISSLGLTAEPETVAPDEYVVPSTGVAEPVPAGIYPIQFTDGEFKVEGSNDRLVVIPSKATCKKNGLTYLAARYAVNVILPTGKTRRVYGRVDLIPEGLKFNDVAEDRQKATNFADLLVNAGWTSPLNSNQDYMNALESIAIKGNAAKALIEWSAYCNPNSKEYRGDGHTIRGMKNFPLNPDGTFNPRVTYHTQYGEDVVLLAQNEIKAIYGIRK